MRAERMCVPAAISLAMLLSAGCGTLGVKPRERDLMARRYMQFDGEPLDSKLDDHLYFSKEASSGRPNLRRRRLRTQLTSTLCRETSAGVALAAAACTLLGFPAEAQIADYLDKGIDIAKDWNLDTALAYYHENGRIQAVEPVVSLSSGSTPNGALTSNRPQTFTSPSGKNFAGRHTYVTPAGQLPSAMRIATSHSPI
jgi:Domain of unknown function (DUF4266)